MFVSVRAREWRADCDFGNSLIAVPEVNAAML
jgi:hypothetical protein